MRLNSSLIISLITILVNVCFDAYGQDHNFTYKATYKLTFQQDSTDLESVKSENMVLFLGNVTSNFSSIGKHEKDSIFSNNPGNLNFEMIMSKMPKTVFNYNIIKNRITGKVIYTTKVLKDQMMYEESISQMKWEIGNETKTIAGYNCQKATTQYSNRNYTAWFTKEIPIADGPYKFSGLPGLIIHIADSKNHYSFELNGFTKLVPAKQDTFDSSVYLITSKNKLNKVMKKYKENPLSMLEQSGITLNFKSEANKSQMLKKHKSELHKKNNPIEL